MSDYKKGVMKESYGALFITLIALFFLGDKISRIQCIHTREFIILLTLCIITIIIIRGKIKYFFKQFLNFWKDIVIGILIILIVNCLLSYNSIRLEHFGPIRYMDIDYVWLVIGSLLSISLYLFITILQLPEGKNE